MPTWQRVYLAACAGIIGYALAYSLSAFGQWPKLTYLPVERRFAVYDVPAGPVPSAYVGLVLWGLSGALVAAAAVSVTTRLFKKEASRRLLILSGAWALTAFLLAGLFFTWGLLVGA